MIKEFAIDPELFCQWNHHLVLRHAFSVDQGRLVAAFPKKWKGLLAAEITRLENSGELPPVRAKTILDWLQVPTGQRDHRMVKSNATFDQMKQWHLNVEDVSGQFDGVLSARELSAQNAILADENHDYMMHPTFKSETQKTIQRRKQPMIDCIWPLLKTSTIVKIVEPHFNPNKARFRDVLDSLLDRLAAEGSAVRELELHVCNPIDRPPGNLDPPSFVPADLHRRLSPLLRSDWRLRFYLWTRGREKLHPRYLLTDRGGIQIDHGWDEGEFASETTPIHLLSKNRFEQEFQRYSPSTEDFVMVPATDIIIIE